MYMKHAACTSPCCCLRDSNTISDMLCDRSHGLNQSVTRISWPDVMIRSGYSAAICMWATSSLYEGNKQCLGPRWLQYHGLHVQYTAVWWYATCTQHVLDSVQHESYLLINRILCFVNKRWLSHIVRCRLCVHRSMGFRCDSVVQYNQTCMLEHWPAISPAAMSECILVYC